MRVWESTEQGETKAEKRRLWQRLRQGIGKLASSRNVEQPDLVGADEVANPMHLELYMFVAPRDHRVARHVYTRSVVFVHKSGLGLRVPDEFEEGPEPDHMLTRFRGGTVLRLG